MKHQSIFERNILTEGSIEKPLDEKYPKEITKRAFEEVEKMIEERKARFNQEKQNSQ